MKGERHDKKPLRQHFKLKSDDIPLHLKVEEALKQIFVESLDNIISYGAIPDITSSAHLDSVK